MRSDTYSFYQSVHQFISLLTKQEEEQVAKNGNVTPKINIFWEEDGFSSVY